MFKYYLVLFITILVVPQVFADTKILYDKETGQVFDITSPGNNPVIPPAKEGRLISSVIKQNKEDMGIDHSLEYYIFNGKDIVLDFKRINAEEKIKSDSDSKTSEMDLIKKRAYKLAYQSLKADGVELKYIKEEDFQ